MLRIDESHLLGSAEKLLAEHGWPNASAYRIYSAGDSDSGREEILFVARDGSARTARVASFQGRHKRIEWIDVDSGW
jgi:hypothetical protein